MTWLAFFFVQSVSVFVGRPSPKDHKNPRKRLRGKFEKAVVRRKGQVRSMREDGGGYAGEASGIKTTVTKSRRFNA
jgi:U3 small nucleolar RNA-associated protein 3